MLVSRHVYLTDTKTVRIDWNKGINAFVFALAFPTLNRLQTHNERTRVLCPSTLVYTLLMTITKITSVRCTKFPMQLCTNT